MYGAKGISIDKSVINIIIGASAQLTATVLPDYATNKSVYWHSSDASVAVVDANGIVRGVSFGNCDIVAETEDGGHTVICSVRVFLDRDIIIEERDIIEKVRVVRHKYNLFQPWNCEIELGDPEERLIEQLKAAFGTTGYIDDTLTSRGQLSGYKLVDNSVLDAKIRSLTADKITAGTITATISIMSPYIYSGELESAYIYGSVIEGGVIRGTIFEGGMFRINPNQAPGSEESGLTIGGQTSGGSWVEYFILKYDPEADYGYPATVFDTWGDPCVFLSRVKFRSYTVFSQEASFNNGASFSNGASFQGVVDFTYATVIGLPEPEPEEPEEPVEPTP